MYGTIQSSSTKPEVGTRLQGGVISGGFYLCNESYGNIHDASGNNSPGLLSGTVHRVHGRFGGYAIQSDGTSGFFTIPLGPGNILNYTLAPYGRPRTIWAWIYNAGSSSVGPIFAKGNNSPDTGFGFALIGGSFTPVGGLQSYTIGADNGHFATSTAVVPVGQWSMVAVTWTGGSALPNTLSMYVNGVNVYNFINVTVGGNPGAQNATDTFNLLIMSSAYIGSGAGQTTYANFAIDHIAWDFRAYGQLEIQKLYAQPFWMFTKPNFYHTYADVPSTTQGRVGGMVREVLCEETGVGRIGGMVREVLCEETGVGRIGGIVREVLMNGETAPIIPVSSKKKTYLRR